MTAAILLFLVALAMNAFFSGTETGFRDPDALTAGMHGGQLIIIAARPAMGCRPTARKAAAPKGIRIR